MKFLTLFTLLFFTVSLSAQSLLDKVVTANGTVYLGLIVKDLPDEALTIRESDGREFRIPYRDVVSRTKTTEAAEVPKLNLSEKLGLGFALSSLGSGAVGRYYLREFQVVELGILRKGAILNCSGWQCPLDDPVIENSWMFAGSFQFFNKSKYNTDKKKTKRYGFAGKLGYSLGTVSETFVGASWGFEKIKDRSLGRSYLFEVGGGLSTLTSKTEEKGYAYFQNDGSNVFSLFLKFQWNWFVKIH